MDKIALFSEIDKLSEKYLQLLKEVTEIESPTNHKNGVDMVLDRIFESAKELSLETERCKQEISGDVGTVTLNPTSKLKPIVFSGHMDTVHPLGTIKLNPVRVDGDMLYGPGVYDCKGGIIASLLAIEALKNVNFTKRPVKLVLQSDEENSSIFSNKKTIEYMAKVSKDAIGFFNAEPYVEGFISTERKGIIRYEFKIVGVAAHSAKCFDGANAITEASHKIIKLEKFKDADGITVNCGLINGGTVANTVPDTCTFVADIRFKTREQLTEIKNFVQQINDEITVKGTSSTVKEVSFRTSMEKTSKNEDLLNAVNQIFAKNDMPTLTARCGAGGSDAADMSTYGIPTLDSIGVKGKNMHSLNEFTYISSIFECAKRLAIIALEI